MATFAVSPTAPVRARPPPLGEVQRHLAPGNRSQDYFTYTRGVHGLRGRAPRRRQGGALRLKRALALGMVAVWTSSSPSLSAQTPSSSAGRTGSGAELLEDCQRYFTFLGRTGAGKEETFDEDPFGIGYCAGLVRGVARSVDDFHPDIECRLDSFTFARAVRAVVLFIEDEPQALTRADTEVVLSALQDAGMCARTRP